MTEVPSVMARLPGEIPPVPRLAGENTVPDRHLAPDGHIPGSSFDRPALKSAVIDIHGLRLRGNFAPVAGIKYDQVRVAPRLNGPLAREEVEQLRHPGAGDVDQGVQAEFPSLHSVGIQQLDPLLERWNPVWNLGEVISAHRLLAFEIEGRVIGRHRLNEPVAQAVPE